jgi:hypothetical protein
VTLLSVTGDDEWEKHVTSCSDRELKEFFEKPRNIKSEKSNCGPHLPAKGPKGLTLDEETRISEVFIET